MADKLRILAVGAHPDDVEILCAGTLAKYAAAGHYVAIACVANGNVGHMEIDPPELARIREQESRDGAAVIGAEFFWLDVPDLMLVMILICICVWWMFFGWQSRMWSLRIRQMTICLIIRLPAN